LKFTREKILEYERLMMAAFIILIYAIDIFKYDGGFCTDNVALATLTSLTLMSIYLFTTSIRGYTVCVFAEAIVYWMYDSSSEAIVTLAFALISCIMILFRFGYELIGHKVEQSDSKKERIKQLFNLDYTPMETTLIVKLIIFVTCITVFINFLSGVDTSLVTFDALLVYLLPMFAELLQCIHIQDGLIVRFIGCVVTTYLLLVTYLLNPGEIVYMYEVFQQILIMFMCVYSIHKGYRDAKYKYGGDLNARY
jgi:hypothetical protein